jgi:hypothetical protein
MDFLGFTEYRMLEMSLKAHDTKTKNYMSWEEFMDFFFKKDDPNHDDFAAMMNGDDEREEDCWWRRIGKTGPRDTNPGVDEEEVGRKFKNAQEEMREMRKKELTSKQRKDVIMTDVMKMLHESRA